MLGSAVSKVGIIQAERDGLRRVHWCLHLCFTLVFASVCLLFKDFKANFHALRLLEAV